MAALCVAVTLAACSGRSDAPDDEAVLRLRKLPARAWLESNKNDSPLASNRFRTASEARAFVEKLFAAGAVEVYVTDPMEEPERLAAEGGPYADSLVIILPSDPARRRALFAMANAEARREGFGASPDVGQKTIFLWWD